MLSSSPVDSNEQSGLRTVLEQRVSDFKVCKSYLGNCIKMEILI